MIAHYFSPVDGFAGVQVTSEKGKEMVFDCSIGKYREGLAIYKTGKICIQDAFPFLTADEREFLISGLTPACWARLFPKGDEE